MPQMSPIMWPVVITILMLLLMMIKSNMEKMSVEKQFAAQKFSINEKKWKW